MGGADSQQISSLLPKDPCPEFDMAHRQAAVCAGMCTIIIADSCNVQSLEAETQPACQRTMAFQRAGVAGACLGSAPRHEGQSTLQLLHVPPPQHQSHPASVANNMMCLSSRAWCHCRAKSDTTDSNRARAAATATGVHCRRWDRLSQALQ